MTVSNKISVKLWPQAVLCNQLSKLAFNKVFLATIRGNGPTSALACISDLFIPKKRSLFNNYCIFVIDKCRNNSKKGGSWCLEATIEFSVLCIIKLFFTGVTLLIVCSYWEGWQNEGLKSFVRPLKGNQYGKSKKTLKKRLATTQFLV